MSDQTSKYISYLLRLWQVDENGHRVWRASLEDPHTGERRSFSSLALLVDFLYGQLIGNEKGGPDNSISETSDKTP